MSGERVIVDNLWAKQLLVGDYITATRPVDTRFRPLAIYTVERSREAHDEAVAARDALDAEAAQRTSGLVWRRRAPSWLRLLALSVVASLTVVGAWAFLIILAAAFDAVAPAL